MTRPASRPRLWLEAHGKKQPWKLFRKETKPFVPAKTYAAGKQALNDALDLGATLQAVAKTRYARPSPYQADPAINALNQAKFADQTRQSYPSKHTVLAAAALALLDRSSRTGPTNTTGWPTRSRSPACTPAATTSPTSPPAHSSAP